MSHERDGNGITIPPSVQGLGWSRGIPAIACCVSFTKRLVCKESRFVVEPCHNTVSDSEKCDWTFTMSSFRASIFSQMSVTKNKCRSAAGVKICFVEDLQPPTFMYPVHSSSCCVATTSCYLKIKELKLCDSWKSFISNRWLPKSPHRA